MSDWPTFIDSDTVLAAICPTCEGVVQVPDPVVGIEVECPECEDLLLVVEVEPLTLVSASDPDEIPSRLEDPREEEA